MSSSTFFLEAVSSQTRPDIESIGQKDAEKMVSIHAAGRGAPHINFADGKELIFTGGENQNAGSNPMLLASADFDSDGIADLITIDQGGFLKFYRGNADSIYPNSPEAQMKRLEIDGQKSEKEIAAPFSSVRQVLQVTVKPDFLVAGDFNADGRIDVLVAQKDDLFLHLLAGDGAGNFATDLPIPIDGKITALEAGEIGRADGQTDLAVAVLGKKGAQLLVFEHPEGAFKYKPETIKLAAAASDLAIGNLDEDFYADIAAASGSRLSIVHGRGQAYPWDLLKEYDIKRPAATIETRIFPFSISALTVGKFTEKRGDNLAILTSHGSLHILEPARDENRQTIVPSAQNAKAGKPAFVPANFNANGFAVIAGDLPGDAETAEKSGLPMMNKEDREKLLRGQSEKPAAPFKKLSAEERSKLTAVDLKRAEESRARAKDEFLKTISPRASAPRLAQWSLQTLATDARLSSAASSPNAEKLVAVRVSDSGKDELALLDTNAKQIHLLAQNSKTDDRRPITELISFESETNPTAILPMRLNADAIDDLIVLREHSSQPAFVISSPAQTFVVNTTDDSNSGGCSGGAEPCSLRRAIILSNQTPGTDAISFNIAGGGVQTIAPTSELPIIQGAVTIDGTTQPGFNGQPLVEIKGANLGSAGDGLRINGSGIVIRGLAINEFKSAADNGSQIGGNGISIFNYEGDSYSRANIIEGNFLGTDPAGELDKGNDATGLNIFDSDDNLVGGTTAQARNVMSGNGNPAANKVGAGLSITAGERNQIKGNFIGTDAPGALRISNSFGVFFTGKNNLFGGDEAGAGNVVSGNGVPVSGQNRCIGEGIKVALLLSPDTEELLTLDNNFKGNKIGTTFDGNAPLGNCSQGIRFDPSTRTILGSITENGRNTISGNGYDAVWCLEEDSSFAPGYCQIAGNNIGTDPSGTVAIPNDQRNIPSGLVVTTATVWVNPGVGEFVNVGAIGGTTPGAACTGFCNLISGNGAGGVERSGLGQVLITNNHVGTNRAGTAALPNNGNGVFSFFDNDVFIGAVFTFQDGSQASGGNLISGNSGGGVLVQRGGGNASNNTQFFVVGNLVGTSVDGLSGIPNNTGGDNDISGHGITVFTADFSRGFIGNVNPLARNVIAGNKGGGIRVSGTGKASIFNNYVGLNKTGAPLGNLTNGIVVRGVNTQVGGTAENEANFIKNNGKAGVLIYETSFGNSLLTKGNKVVGNSIANNGGLGIELTNIYEFGTSDGVTANDCLDADEGPNRLQNFPVLTAPVFNENGTVTVGGGLQSTPSSSFTLDFYSNTTVDPTKYGEGEAHIGSKTVVTDSEGVTTFEFTSTAQIPANQKITATATDAEGNTSEFSCAAGECTDGAGGLSKEEILELMPPTCLVPIIVNISTDQPDANPNEGICDVDAATTGSQCSLRAAIQTANARTGFDLINFNIPSGGLKTIAPTTALPSITEKVFIDATTQPGYSNSPLIELNGANTGAASDGLAFSQGSDGSTVMGLTINRFADTGIVFYSNQNRLEKSYIGLFADGLSVDSTGRQRVGVLVLGRENNIGGARTVANNVERANNFIAGNRLSQILISSSLATGNVVKGNDIGVNVNAVVPAGNFQDGIKITVSASGNRIGGTAAAEANFIQGDSHGVHINGNADENTISRNVITGCEVGVEINGASNNTIGGAAAVNSETTSRNVIGNNDIGIFIGDTPSPLAGESNRTAQTSAALVTQTRDNKIYGNTIGIAPNTDDFSNDFGIVIGTAEETLVGTGEIGFNNFISGNSLEGVVMEKTAARNKIRGNFIGTAINGTSAKPNRSGVKIAGSENELINNIISGNTEYGVVIDPLAEGDPLPLKNVINNNRIGTTGAGSTALPNGQAGIFLDGRETTITSNTISGNQVGISIVPFSATPAAYPSLNIIQKNFIGTNSTGTAAVPNTQFGIALANGANNNLIGGATANVGNVISGNGTDGINIQAGAQTGAIAPSENKIQGNFVGTNAAGNAAIPNSRHGISISGGKTTLIGGFGDDIPNARNVISGNGGDGVRLQFGAMQNRVSGNYIGTQSDGVSALGNTAKGIAIGVTAANNIIGGTEPNSGNVVAFNAGSGVALSADAGSGNLIDPNRIFLNGGLGIDIGEDGHTPNDAADADAGANNLQNYPDIVSKQIVNNELIVGFKVDSAPANSAYGTNGIYVEFFKADASGEGEKFLGFGYYTEADYNGSLQIKTINLGNINTLGFAPNDRLTATASDANGNSSEFTPTFAPTAASVSVGGRVLTADGRGIYKARISLTDATGETRTALTNPLGSFRFGNVPAGQTYIITTQHKSYRFVSPTQVLSVSEELSDVDFTASP
ncbi:MAG TPA: right-handed parallel beta-helix repeat-containing protein [Pyrinomonadaceae bacterium]